MVNLTFFGRVHPERANLSLGMPVTIKHDNYELVIHIYANQIIVRAKFSEELGNDIPTMRNIVSEKVQSITDLTSFVFQTGYQVEIISVIDNDDCNNARTFGVDLEIIKDDVKLREKKFFELLPLIGHSPYVALALSDIRLAINVPIDTGVYCYRAFESILRDFKIPENANKKRKYDLNGMGNDLNICSVEKLKKYLGKYAGDRRHGEVVTISYKERKEVMKRIWMLMDRYLEYLKNNREPLSKEKFADLNFSLV